MGRKYRLYLAFCVFLLVFSLFGIILYFIRGASHSTILNGLLLYVVVLVVSLFQLRVPVYLASLVLIHRTLLKQLQKGKLRYPRESDVSLAKCIILMRLASFRFRKTRMLLSWDNPEKYVLEVNQIIAEDLLLVIAALQALNTAFQLDGVGLLTRRGGTSREIQITLKRVQVAQVCLARFTVLFLQEVEKKSDYQAGDALLAALYWLCTSIHSNPLLPGAFIDGSYLMAYLHREELANLFREVANHIGDAHEQATGKKIVFPTLPGFS